MSASSRYRSPAGASAAATDPGRPACSMCPPARPRPDEKDRHRLRDGRGDGSTPRRREPEGSRASLPVGAVCARAAFPVPAVPTDLATASGTTSVGALKPNAIVVERTLRLSGRRRPGRQRDPAGSHGDPSHPLACVPDRLVDLVDEPPEPVERTRGNPRDLRSFREALGPYAG